MRIAILGAGNTGRIMAFDLARQGAAVNLYTGSTEKAEHITRHGITAQGKLTGTVRLALATTNMEQAVNGAEVIFIMTTAAGHRPLAERLRPHVRKGQTVISFNANWGGLELCEVLGVVPGAENPKIAVGETATQLYIGAATGPGTVYVKQIKERVGLALAANGFCATLLERLKPFLPQLVPAGSIVETSLSSANAIVHTPVCLFNVSRIELGEDFLFYAQGASPGTVAYMERIDEERVALMRALGLPAPNMLEILNSFWPEKRTTLYEAIHENASYKVVPGPTSTDHRFFTEDIPFGIVPLVHLGKELGVPTPYCDAMLESFGRFFGKDLVLEGYRPDLRMVKAMIAK